MRLRHLLAVLFCLALLGAKGLGLHFHEPGHSGHGHASTPLTHVDGHEELLWNHAQIHEVDDDVDVDWVAAAAQSMPKVLLVLLLLMVGAVLTVVPELKRCTAYVPLRPPRGGVRIGLPPPVRGPPALS